MRKLKSLARAMGLKVIYNHLQDLVLKWRGFNLLSAAETAAFMAPYQVKVIPGSNAMLQQVTNCADPEKTIFPEKESVTDQVYVWDYRDSVKTGSLSKYGSAIIRRKVLCTDWNHSSFYKDIWQADKRHVKTAPCLIALFSQYQDGIFYGGYYDFVFLVATKLCRIKDALPDEDLSSATISYPMFNAPYEADYLDLLGFNAGNLADSEAIRIVSPRLITANSAHWYPNLADILSLKQHVGKKFKPVKISSDRIYISRSGRRRITNEDELIVMLKKFGFLIVEDKPRSVTEQITIYHNASFILGPHGASFSNIIWCEPGTHLFELFSPDYVPDFFLYIATVMGMKYSAFYEGVADDKVDYLDGLVEDIYMPITKLEACLENIFNNIV